MCVCIYLILNLAVEITVVYVRELLLLILTFKQIFPTKYKTIDAGVEQTGVSETSV